MTYQESFFFGNANQAKDTRDLPFQLQAIQKVQQKKIYLGTSSWKFRGWEGMVYSSSYSSQLEFEKNCFREYSELFTTVSLDATYYDWPRESYMRKLLDQSPESFRYCLKATNELTMPTFPVHPRYGNLAGKENPGFLNAETFLMRFWQPLSFMHDRVSAVVFEFSKGGLSDEHAQAKLAQFLEHIPNDIPLFVEVRDRELWNEDFLGMIKQSGHQMALHSYTNLPSIAWQWKRLKSAGLATEKPVLLRALLPTHREKADSMEWMAPYDQVLELQEDFHRELAKICEEIVANKGLAYFIFGNCLEGSAPQSVGRFLRSYKQTTESNLVQ